MPVNPGKGLWMTWNMRYNEKRRWSLVKSQGERGVVGKGMAWNKGRMLNIYSESSEWVVPLEWMADRWEAFTIMKVGRNQSLLPTTFPSRRIQLFFS